MRKAVIVFLLLSAIFSIAQRSNRRLMLANNPSASAECAVTTNAIVVTSLASFGNTSNFSSYATASVNPVADATLILFAAFSPVGTETVTNTGTTQLTWWSLTNKSYNTIASPAHEAVAWISQMPPGTASFAMQVVLGNTSGSGANMHLLQVTGADTNQLWGSNAVVQIVTAVSNATANPQITIAAPNAGASNAVLVAFADDLNATTDNAAGSGTTELAETAYNTPAAGLSSYYRLNAPASMTLATNIATARDWSAIALEIKAGTNACPAGGGGGFDFVETFEGIGFDETYGPANWTQLGTPDEDYTGTVLEGSQSCLIGVGSHNIQIDLGDGAQWEVYFRLRMNSISGNQNIAYILDSTDTIISLLVVINAGGDLHVGDNLGNYTSPAIDLNVDTTYHIWWRYEKGTGANGVFKLGVSTDGIRPTSGAGYAEQLAHQRTTDADELRFFVENVATWDIIIDRVIVNFDGETIGNNP